MKGLAMLRSLPSGEERRGLTLIDAGVSVIAADSGERRFAGHAAVFNERAAIGNPRTYGFYEQVSPGAFNKTLQEADVRFLIDHSSYHVVSRMSAGTLALHQDARGLAVDSALDTRLSYVNDMMANLDNGNVRGMSYGFHVVKDEWSELEERDGNGGMVTVPMRDLKELALIETSSVTFPAFEGTDAGLRHLIVPALRSRGDMDAIARAVSFKPELGPLLGYDPELAPTHIDLGARAMAKDPKKPYGDVEYADPGYQSDGVSRYPLDSAAHVKSAWDFINVASNAEKYTSAQVASIKSKIQAAAKKFGVEISSDEKKSAGEPGETTQQSDNGETPEPAASTRNAPSQHQLAALQLKLRKAQLRKVA